MANVYGIFGACCPFGRHRATERLEATLYYADGMIRREIELDEESDRVLSGLAQEYQGDLGRALADLLHAHKTIESFVDQCEGVHRDSLIAQRDRSERGFQEGRFTAWEEVKRSNKL